MPATSIKLSPELKKRIASIAEAQGQSPHAFMVEAIEEKTRLAEQRRSFVADALKAREHAMRTGKAFAFEDVKAYYTARLSGKPTKRPRLKRWRG